MIAFSQSPIELWLFLLMCILIMIFIVKRNSGHNVSTSMNEHSLLDINEELDTVIKSVHSASSHQDIQIKYSSTLEQTTFIKGNKNNFHHALYNLVKNGLDASQNGKIEIAVHEMLSSILIVIEHNGKCMTNEQIKKLKAILPASDIIDSMKGKIEIVSQQDKGTMFSVIIPKASGFKANII